MILSEKTVNVSTYSQIESDLLLIINSYSKTISDYECEAILPITMWAEIEESKSDLLRIINIINDEDIDLATEDENNDIISYIQEANDSLPYTTPSVINSSNTSDCSPCVPIKINFSSSFNKPELKVRLKSVIDSSNFMFSSNSSLVCSTASVVSSGCIPDLLKIIGTLLMAINTIISSLDISSMSISSYLSATIGASLDITVKRAMFMANISVSKSDCLSKYIKQIIDALPTSENLQKTVDKSILEKFRLNNIKADGIENLLKTIDYTISNTTEKTSTDVSRSLNTLLNTIDSAINRVNDWIGGTIGMVNYLPCEKKRENTSPSEIVEEVSNLLTIINTIMAVLNKKYKNKICNTSSDTTASNNEEEQNLSVDDISDIISSLTDVENVIKDNNGNTIGIILPSLELRTSYIDTFGCNLPTFLSVASKTFTNKTEEITNSIESTNANQGIIWNYINNNESNGSDSSNNVNDKYINNNTTATTASSNSQITTSVSEESNFFDISTILNTINSLNKSIANDSTSGAIYNNDNSKENLDTYEDVEIKTITSNNMFSIEKDIKELLSSSVSIQSSGECK